MVVTDTLEKVSLKELLPVYNEAFSDYQITLSTSEEKLQNILARNGYHPEVSVGLFDDSTLVGFVLNGVRGNYGYDSGTAIIPSYRGKGYARLLLEKTLSVLRDQAIHTWVLEVLSDNAKAINLYTSVGFVQQRKFNCYQVKAEAIKKEETALTLRRQRIITVPQGECIPSWQNTEQAIIAGGIPTWDIILGKKKVGTLCYDPHTGSIAQIYIKEEHRRKKYAQEAIIEKAKFSKTDQLRFINLDDRYQPIHKLLLSLGFTCFTTQWEMTNTIESRP